MREEVKIKNTLVWIIDILNRKKIPFQISGGLAAKIYGSPRELNDIDIDIPEENFIDIYKDVKAYIVYGPDQYKDEKWDCYLMTLNYLGQEIDICGTNNTRITSKDNKTWLSLCSDLKNVNYQKYLDIIIPVIPRQKLIDYKKHLNGEHQLIDINAII